MENSSENGSAGMVHTSPPKSVNHVTEVLDRLKKAAKASTDAQLAVFLEIKSQGIVQARKKLMIPPAWLFIASEKAGVSLDWLYYGHGSQNSPYFPDEPCSTGYILDDIYSRIDFKNKIYMIECEGFPRPVFEILGYLWVHFDVFLEVILSENGHPFSYFVFGCIDRGHDCYVVFDYKFDHYINGDAVEIERINSFLSIYKLEVLRFHSTDKGVFNLLKFYYQSQNLNVMKNFFMKGVKSESTPADLSANKSDDSRYTSQFQKDMDHTVLTLKSLGTDDKTIQQAVIKLIERGK